VQEKLGNVKTFMIGAGALGCELAKAFALMGVGCGPEGKITVTDNDNIEVSNLNRQFLFRKNNVGKPKSETACGIAKIMNPDLKVNALTSLLSQDTEDVFNDQFWEELDFVVNAVDNIKARLHIDQKCVWYQKPLLESGTLGTKANQQMVVPHVTQCYGDSQDPPEESIPMCTLRSFPNLIEHCIEWGRAKFEGLFSQRCMDAIDLLKNQEQWLKDARQSETSSGVCEKLRNIKEFIALKNGASMLSCVQEARAIYEEFYDYDIQDLLSLLPADHKDSSGNPFWSGPKRCPGPIPFDVEDPVAFSFVFNAANLIAVNIRIAPERDPDAVKALIAQTQSKGYVKKAIVVETPEEAKEREEAGRPAPVAPSDQDDEAVITELLGILRISAEGVKEADIDPADFEKDDDTNFHIDFISACSNLRARNYRIPECDRNKCKMIAGKIIPAIATTTAMVTGSVSTELLKFAQGFTDITKFKNSFINLALPSVMFTEPDDVKKIKSKDYDPIIGGAVKAIPDEYTVYDKTVIKEGSLTV
jgi:ubiquitin-activating enzyme E1